MHAPCAVVVVTCLTAYTGAPPHTPAKCRKTYCLPLGNLMLDTGTHVTPFCLGLRLPEKHCHNPMCMKVEGGGKDCRYSSFSFTYNACRLKSATLADVQKRHQQCMLLSSFQRYTHTQRPTFAKLAPREIRQLRVVEGKKALGPLNRNVFLLFGAELLAQVLRSRRSLRKPSGVRMWSEPMITSQFLTSLVTSYAQRISE